MRSHLVLCSMQRHPSRNAKKPQRHPSRNAKKPASCTIRFISRAFQCPASSATAQRDPGFYMANILDPANSKRSYGSSQKDTDMEPAAAAVAAAGHLVSSLSTAVYILGAILKISVCCENL